MTHEFRAACIQMRSGVDIERNMSEASRLILEAKALGADFVATPEMTTLFEGEGEALLAKAQTEAADICVPRFRALAEELGIWLLVGSMPIKVSDTQCANRSYLIGPDGRVAATYDKIHMFDVQVGDGQTYRESSRFRPGTRAVVTETSWGPVGLSICYDVRFAYLYRTLAHAGAKLLTVPAAFTRVTGEAHWHVLLRARAIETGSFVVAPAQCGRHENGRETFGHSLIIDPWGRILAEGGTEPGIFMATIDFKASDEARAKIPALKHDCDFAG
ncbi:MAG TPA: amidohydrolase, partial [Alphaproteobacteria bacterium]|nr:amidohydrolase [Alphaproteobacteria bacterium]